MQRKAAETLIPEITRYIGTVKSGDSRVHPERLSALYAEQSAVNLLSMITEAEADGATILVGDKQREGAVVQPHVLLNVKPGMKMWDRETFGPGTSEDVLLRIE